MKIELEPITQDRKFAFTQMLILYNFCYDLTEFLNDDIPENGYFSGDADYFMSNEKSYNFFIRVDEKIAGFVIIGDGGCCYLDNEKAHNIDLFFVTRKYRRNGVGRFAAKLAFDMFDGEWEVCQMQENKIAQEFWRAIIADYTGNNYRECGTKNDEMVGFVFKK